MIPIMLHDFFGKLLQITNEGRLQWKSASERSYFCVHNGTTVNVSYHFDHDRELSSFSLNIVSADGDETTFACNQFEIDDYDRMRLLFEAASANAFNPDKTLGDFFRGL